MSERPSGPFWQSSGGRGGRYHTFIAHGPSGSGAMGSGSVSGRPSSPYISASRPGSDGIRPRAPQTKPPPDWDSSVSTARTMRAGRKFVEAGTGVSSFSWGDQQRPPPSRVYLGGSSMRGSSAGMRGIGSGRPSSRDGRAGSTGRAANVAGMGGGHVPAQPSQSNRANTAPSGTSRSFRIPQQSHAPPGRPASQQLIRVSRAPPRNNTPVRGGTAPGAAQLSLFQRLSNLGTARKPEHGTMLSPGANSFAVSNGSSPVRPVRTGSLTAAWGSETQNEGKEDSGEQAQATPAAAPQGGAHSSSAARSAAPGYPSLGSASAGRQQRLALRTSMGARPPSSRQVAPAASSSSHKAEKDVGGAQPAKAASAHGPGRREDSSDIASNGHGQSSGVVRGSSAQDHAGNIGQPLSTLRPGHDGAQASSRVRPTSSTGMRSSAGGDAAPRRSAGSAGADARPGPTVSNGGSSGPDAAHATGRSTLTPAGPPSSQHLPASTRPASAAPGRTSSGLSPATGLAEYKIGKVIGEGGFCQVREGWHNLSGRKVAIKVIDKARLSDINDRKRIAREIKVLKKLHHSCIIRCFDVIDTSSKIYIVMENAQGGSLLDHVRQRKRLPEREAAMFLQQIVHGLMYCHSKGVVHRDIKLENILLDRDDSVRVIDFGLSAITAPGKKLKVYCGSPSYAAPEIVARRHYDGPPVDVWSLGVVLFAMVCGFLPFHAGGDRQALCKKIMKGHFTLPDFVSEDVSDLLRHMLTVDPSQRISLRSILQHRWVTQGMRWTPPATDRYHVPTGPNGGVLLNTEVVRVLERHGFAAPDIQDAINNRECCGATAAYFLVAEKLAPAAGSRATSATVREPVVGGSAHDGPLRAGTAPAVPGPKRNGIGSDGGSSRAQSLGNSDGEAEGSNGRKPESQSTRETVLYSNPHKAHVRLVATQQAAAAASAARPPVGVAW
ncbi:unnamed protein product [Pedinophyceae sp. YPF-701]|nr:unnamed protein product [Pedinophyceae sp. YPF-701]